VSRPEGRQVFSNFGFSLLCAIGNLEMEKNWVFGHGFLIFGTGLGCFLHSCLRKHFCIYKLGFGHD
jgi:hypothetical protein